MAGRRSFLTSIGGGAFAILSGCSRQSRPVTTSRATPTSLPPLDVPDSLPDPSLGTRDAPVVVDYFGDFACPQCETYHHNAFGKLREKYIETGKVHYVYHDFPKISQTSWDVAAAARAVQHDVGSEAFWAFSDEIYEANLGYASPEKLGRHAATSVGADATFVKRVVSEDAFRAFLEKQHRDAKGHVNFVPATLVNGSFTIPNYSVLSARIDYTLEEQ